MKFVGNIIAVAFLVFLGYLSIDFSAKEAGTVNTKTPTYSQFMTCDIGENWSNVNEMMDDWNNMEVDGMSFALGHMIYEGDANGINSNQVSWQLFWDSKQKADKFWGAGPTQEFKAWADKYDQLCLVMERVEETMMLNYQDLKKNRVNGMVIQN